MANEEKNTEKKEITPARGERWLSPFEEAEHWFEDFFPRGWMHPLRHGWPSRPDLEAPFSGRMPRVDIIDRENEIVVRAELPGVDKDDLDVSMTDHSVTIRATTSYERKEEKGEYYRREMSRGEFQRTLLLPDNVDADKAKANFKDGVLELALPKVESAKRKTIKVE
jgi:HSP20 family protein